MATYVVLYRFTPEGAKNVRGTVERARETRRRNEERGFRVHGMYWTQGRYDLIAVVEAPSEEAMMSGMLNVVAAGNVQSETLRAFTEQEMESIVKAV